MNSHMEFEQFDIKNEEDPLMITEIKSEPQCEAKSVDKFSTPENSAYTTSNIEIEDIECSITEDFNGYDSDKDKECVPDSSSDFSSNKSSSRPKTRRKGKYGLSREENKLKRNRNEEHFNYKGVKVHKDFKDFICSCTNKCHEKLSVQFRKQQFVKFWEIGAYDAQAIFIAAHVSEHAVKKQYEKTDKSRTFSRIYHLGDCRVCRDMFIRTLSISTKRVDTALKKMRCDSILDKRGKNQGGHNKISEQKIEEVVKQINKIPSYKSHYWIDSTGAEYLPPDLTLQDMYELYKKEVSEPENKFEVKEKSEECKNCDEHVDIRHEIKPISQLTATTETKIEVKETEESVVKLVEDNEKKSQEEQKNTEDKKTNSLLLVNELCGSYGKDLQEEKCKMSVCVQTGENVNPFPELNNFDFCNKDFSDESNYTTRMYVHSGEKHYTCNFCTKTFACKSHVTRHIRIHTGEKPFTCDSCSNSFSKKCSLIKHISLHTNVKLFTCNVCSKSFSRRSYLASHRSVHINIKSLSCNFCMKTFSRKSELAIHIRTHTNEKPFTCTICVKSFSDKSYLTTHIRTHTNEKPFTCTICMKSFSHKSHLTGHIRTHTNEKPFTCTICRKSFSHKSHLVTHFRTHTNEKPFTCTVCMKSFSNKSNLATHIRTHTKDKPFTCIICRKSFSQKSHLVTHIRTHTND